MAIQHVAIVDTALRVWFILTTLATAYVVYDALTRNPELRVMRYGWILVTLYTGPVGAVVYVLSCQEPRAGTHKEFVKPLWKQSVGSTIHCLAGDATGIIAAAAVTMALGFPMWHDIISEYVFGFLFGLLIFQALFMREMLGGSYWGAVRKSFLPEWLSMNAVMAGMIPPMVILMSRDMGAMHPMSLRFWGVMSLSTLIGFATSYPINMWLVAAQLKHGMGTEKVLGEGGHSTAQDPGVTEAPSAHRGMKQAGAMAMDHEGKVPTPDRTSSAGHVMMARATRPQLVAMTVLSLLMLAVGVLIAALNGDLTMGGSNTSTPSPKSMPM